MCLSTILRPKEVPIGKGTRLKIGYLFRLNTIPCTATSSMREATRPASDLPKLLTTRGRLYLKRQWNGDSYAALVDLLYAHQLSTEAAQRAQIHYYVCVALSNLTQPELARRCRELYLTRYQTIEDTEKMKQLENDSQIQLTFLIHCHSH